MNKEETVNAGDEQINEEKSEGKNDGGLKISTNVKAGSGSPIIIDGGG